jgi:hypothetical protein
MRWRVAKDAGLVAALVPALQFEGNQNLQDWALHILLAAASTGDAEVCSHIINFPGLVECLLNMLPGAARPREAATHLASALATSSDGAQLTGGLLTTLAGRQATEGSTSGHQAEAAAWQAVWVLTHLTSTTAEGGGSTLPASMAALLPEAGSNSEQHSRLRQSLTSKLGAVLSDEPSSAPEKLDALSALASSVPAEERAQMASCMHVVCGLADYLERCYDSDGHASCRLGVAAAEAAAVQLFADTKPQRASLAASTRKASSDASMLTWLTENNDTLQQMVAGDWGDLTVAQLASIAKVTGQAWAKQQQQLPAVKCEKDGQHPDVKCEPRGKQQQQQQSIIKCEQDGQQQLTIKPDIDRQLQKELPPQPPAPVPPVPPTPRPACAQPPAAALLLAAAGALQRHAQAANRKAPLPARPHAPTCRQQDQPMPASKFAVGDKLPAGHAAARSHASWGKEATTHARLPVQATASRHGEPPVLQLSEHSTKNADTISARQVAAVAIEGLRLPFIAKRLESLCSTYLRCLFMGESQQPAVRSQELVPLLQQLHAQAKAEQPVATRTRAAAVAAVQPTPATVKLLHALQLLQHWDIVCPTQPGMPEALQQMIREAGCAAAGTAADSGADDVQVVDTEPAAQVDSDLEAQLQQLEDGLRELVLVKYVPGSNKQPGVQKTQAVGDQQEAMEPTAVVKQEAPPAAPCARPVQQPGAQQQQDERPDKQAAQPASCRVQ